MLALIKKWKGIAIGVAVMLVLLFGIPVVSKAIRSGMYATAKSVVSGILPDSGYKKKITAVGPTRFTFDPSRVMAADVPVFVSKTMRVNNSSEGKVYSGLLNVVDHSKADLPLRGVVLMHLSRKQVMNKSAVKIPAQHIVRMQLPQPVATKEDVWYRPQDLKNVKQGILNRLGAGFLNNQVKVAKVYEDGQSKLSAEAMANSGAMTKARKYIRDIAQSWISRLPGYRGYRVVIKWTGTDLSGKV